MKDRLTITVSEAAKTIVAEILRQHPHLEGNVSGAVAVALYDWREQHAEDLLAPQEKDPTLGVLGLVADTPAARAVEYLTQRIWAEVGDSVVAGFPVVAEDVISAVAGTMDMEIWALALETLGGSESAVEALITEAEATIRQMEPDEINRQINPLWDQLPQDMKTYE